MLTVNEGLEDQDKYFVVVVEMMPLQCPLQVLSSIHVPTALIAVFRIPTSGLQHSNPCFRSVCTVHVLCFCLRFPYLVPPTIFDEFHRHCGLLGQKITTQFWSLRRRLFSMNSLSWSFHSQFLEESIFYWLSKILLASSVQLKEKVLQF